MAWLGQRRPPLALAAAIAVVASALLLTSCGDDSSGTIPGEPAQALIAQLDQLETSVEEGNCDTAQAQALTFAEDVNQLPADVDRAVRNKLVEGAGNLKTLTDEQCEPQITGPSGQTGVVPEAETADSATTPAVEPEEPATEVPDSGKATEPGSAAGGNPGNNGGGKPGNGGGSSSGGVGSG